MVVKVKFPLFGDLSQSVEWQERGRQLRSRRVRFDELPQVAKEIDEEGQAASLISVLEQIVAPSVAAMGEIGDGVSVQGVSQTTACACVVRS